MKNTQLPLAVLVVGLSLGTAWAIRGRFGHEQGAAWAGAIGALSLILLARRADWYKKAFSILMASAFGWGLSGMMSYGNIVGYGRANDFVNVFYGLLMLFVLGILYGFLGGGFFALALTDSKTSRVKWHSLLAEMVALALLTYGLLINQLEWFMTPPRSELWAACLGGAIALAWYVVRHRHENVLKVAVWSALGAGFGFAFGNFLQVIGYALGIEFNFWNVMEYFIGFSGGIGMAYGTLTSSWPVAEDEPRRGYELAGILFVAFFVPFVVWEQSFVTKRFDFILTAGGSATTILYFKVIALVSIGVVGVLTLRRTRSDEEAVQYNWVRNFFILYTGLYIFLSFLVTGIFTHPPEQYLYVLNLLVILFLLPRAQAAFQVTEAKTGPWARAAILAVLAIAVLAVIAMNSHEEIKGSNLRFVISDK